MFRARTFIQHRMAQSKEIYSTAPHPDWAEGYMSGMRDLLTFYVGTINPGTWEAWEPQMLRRMLMLTRTASDVYPKFNAMRMLGEIAAIIDVQTYIYGVCQELQQQEQKSFKHSKQGE